MGLMEHNHNDVAYYHPLVMYMIPIINTFHLRGVYVLRGLSCQLS
jgi:hypothetical protein